LEDRKNARAKNDYASSDYLRDKISEMGWRVQDSKEGQKLVKR
jgi:cysteinyl-tRNA synthetase